jgi:hypothetical protein
VDDEKSEQEGLFSSSKFKSSSKNAFKFGGKDENEKNDLINTDEILDAAKKIFLE